MKINVKQLVLEISKPGLDLFSVQSLIEQAIATARAEALREATERAVDWVVIHWSALGGVRGKAVDLRAAILADKQEPKKSATCPGKCPSYGGDHYDDCPHNIRRKRQEPSQ